MYCLYGGAVDVKRQEPNVKRMELLGAKVVPVTEGQGGTLKEATNAAMREWVSCVEDTHYIIGSIVGPYPFPKMVSHFQAVIGDEAKEQCAELGITPDCVVACVGGGSNAIGIFSGFLDQHVEIFGVEAGGTSDEDCMHARTLGKGNPGYCTAHILIWFRHLNIRYPMFIRYPQGLTIRGIGPVHSMLHDVGRVKYGYVRDNEALNAFKELSRHEGIIPALESSHALAYVLENKEKFAGKKVWLIYQGEGGIKIWRLSSKGGG